MYLNHLGVICALGNNLHEVWQNAVRGSQRGMQTSNFPLVDGTPIIAGQVADEQLPSLAALPPNYQTRNNRLAAAALTNLRSAIENCKAQFGAERVAVIVGTSTSGIAEGEHALKHYTQQQKLPDSFHYSMQEMAAPADFIAHYCGVGGPRYSISIACSSSARALMSAREILSSGLADAVIVGGVDSLCRLTLNGFRALESTSAGLCQPFSKQRDGINIGEAAAFFIATREPLADAADQIYLRGAGHASDAYHMTAPEPHGRGAQLAISAALRQANLAPQAIDYINLHGTGTALNDAMEASALASLELNHAFASSTKPMTGHTLGAAGALEAALCWLTLNATEGQLPKHCYDGDYDDAIEKLPLVTSDSKLEHRAQHCLSNSFAFGGNNVALIFSRSEAGGTTNDDID
ncbi:beta-ketoacyl-ACP synthase [Pseudidiomarina sp. CB1]|uniref:beta-ketoacyl-ACP synthase n=1 Tax=Pseudidiomarina sp. CB1 TaxID=2972484 RepID=UPI002163A300|nr:beta-ketoacyl-ACP synthase [Pseudidiomarina sp. CB1]